MQQGEFAEVKFHIEKEIAVDVEPYGFRLYASSGDTVKMRFINNQGQDASVSFSTESLTLCCYEPVVLLNEQIIFDMSRNRDA